MKLTATEKKIVIAIINCSPIIINKMINNGLVVILLLQDHN